MRIPPESEDPDSGSKPPRGAEGADQRETRERDLMRELDEVTGRRVAGEKREPPEEVVDE
jgi:hypothetical protein